MRWCTDQSKSSCWGELESCSGDALQFIVRFLKPCAASFWEAVSAPLMLLGISLQLLSLFCSWSSARLVKHFDAICIAVSCSVYVCYA